MSAAPIYSIGVISDTHGYLPNRVFDLFAGVDLILHAGDVGGEEVLIALDAIAPVKAVTGNVDVASSRLPLFQQLETPAGRIGMTHGHLGHCSSLEPELMIRHFAAFDPAIIIFGHSHIPLLRREGERWLLNPGSAGRARFGRGPSVGLIRVAEPGAPPELQLLPLEPPK